MENYRARLSTIFRVWDMPLAENLRAVLMQTVQILGLVKWGRLGRRHLEYGM